MDHVVNCYPGTFREFKRGSRVNDVQPTNDRVFKEGDRILYREYDPADAAHTGETLRFRITRVARGGPGQVALTLVADPIPAAKGDQEEARSRHDAKGAERL